MKSLINYFRKWTPMRYIRLGLSVLLFVQAVDSKVWVLLIPVFYLLIQAVFNFGCKNDSCRV